MSADASRAPGASVYDFARGFHPSLLNAQGVPQSTAEHQMYVVPRLRADSNGIADDHGDGPVPATRGGAGGFLCSTAVPRGGLVRSAGGKADRSRETSLGPRSALASMGASSSREEPGEPPVEVCGGAGGQHPLSTAPTALSGPSQSGPPPAAAAISGPGSGASAPPVSATAAKHSRTNLFVRHLPASFNEERLKEVFGIFGRISSHAVMRNIHTGESLGTAFVRFETSEEAKAALEGFNAFVKSWHATHGGRGSATATATATATGGVDSTSAAPGGVHSSSAGAPATASAEGATPMARLNAIFERLFAGSGGAGPGGTSGSLNMVVQWAKREHDSTPTGTERHRLKKLFVRNIPPGEATIDRLMPLFGRFGSVKSLTVHRDTIAAASAASPTSASLTHPAGGATVSVPDLPPAHPNSSSLAPLEERRIAFVTYEEDGAAERAAAAVHNTKPFETCNGVPLMVKLAEDAPVKHVGHTPGAPMGGQGHPTGAIGSRASGADARPRLLRSVSPYTSLSGSPRQQGMTATVGGATGLHSSAHHHGRGGSGGGSGGMASTSPRYFATQPLRASPLSMDISHANSATSQHLYGGVSGAGSYAHGNARPVPTPTHSSGGPGRETGFDGARVLGGSGKRHSLDAVSLPSPSATLTQLSFAAMTGGGAGSAAGGTPLTSVVTPRATPDFSPEYIPIQEFTSSSNVLAMGAGLGGSQTCAFQPSARTYSLSSTSGPAPYHHPRNASMGSSGIGMAPVPAGAGVGAATPAATAAAVGGGGAPSFGGAASSPCACTLAQHTMMGGGGGGGGGSGSPNYFQLPSSRSLAGGTTLAAAGPASRPHGTSQGGAVPAMASLPGAAPALTMSAPLFSTSPMGEGGPVPGTCPLPGARLLGGVAALPDNTLVHYAGPSLGWIPVLTAATLPATTGHAGVDACRPGPLPSPLHCRRLSPRTHYPSLPATPPNGLAAPALSPAHAEPHPLQPALYMGEGAAHVRPVGTVRPIGVEAEHEETSGRGSTLVNELYSRFSQCAAKSQTELQGQRDDGGAASALGSTMCSSMGVTLQDSAVVQAQLPTKFEFTYQQERPKPSQQQQQHLQQMLAQMLGTQGGDDGGSAFNTFFAGSGLSAGGLALSSGAFTEAAAPALGSSGPSAGDSLAASPSHVAPVQRDASAVESDSDIDNFADEEVNRLLSVFRSGQE